MRDTGETELTPALLGFAHRLRADGVRADLHRVETLFAALATHADPGIVELYNAGRLTLCASRDELAKYDRAFAAYFLAAAEVADDENSPPSPPSLRPGSARVQKRGLTDEPEQEMQLGAASEEEVLRHRSIAGLTPAERAQIYALIARLRAKVATRRSRRYRSATRPMLDVRRTVRAALAHGGDPDRLYRKQHRQRPRRRIMMIDVSGSMSPYAGGLLRLAYATCRCAPRLTEVFTLGTRLTRVTPFLAGDDPDRAVALASRAIPDWSGGTRLGDQLKAFLDLWGQRGMARGAIVVIASDGMERGGPDLLGQQMQRLSRLAHRVIWANPHKSSPGFEPLMGGMRAALPSVHDFVGGSSAVELERLLELMATSRSRCQVAAGRIARVHTADPSEPAAIRRAR